jgi:hypothetical protein
MIPFPPIRAVVPAALLGAASIGFCQSSTPGNFHLYAIVGARIEIGDGRVLEKGTVVIRDGLIEAIAAMNATKSASRKDRYACHRRNMCSSCDSCCGTLLCCG